MPAVRGHVMLKMNGEWLLRKDWGRIVAPGDFVEWHEIPQGGNTSRSILSVVVMALAVYYGYAVGQVFGQGWGAAATIAFNVIGTAVVNALMPIKTADNGLGSASSPGSVYNVNASANQARLGQPIPVIYGRHRIFPDYASQPYVEYQENDQYFFALYCIGQGFYVLPDGSIFIDDTRLNHFSDIWYRKLEPGELPTRVHANVVTSPEVTGQAIEYGRYTGAFAACGPRQTATEIGVDVLFDRLGYADNDGNMGSKSVPVRFEARTIDDFGVATGAWFALGSRTFEAATTTPQRFSTKYTLPTPARVEVRAIRTDEREESSRVFNDPVWGGLRSYLSTPAALSSSATHFELVMRASEQLSGISQRKVNMIPRRRLHTWHPDTGWSAEPVETRSIAWALADVWKNAAYGDNLPDERIDLQTLYELDQVWTARQDRLDIVFDSRITSWDAAKTIAQCGRAMPFRRMGVNTLARDQKQDLPVTAYTTRNMLPGASIGYSLPTEQTADGIIVEYFDNRAWDWREVMCRAPGVAEPQNAVRLRIAGITGVKHAEREGLYQATQNLYRRKFPTWTTELEGMLPAYGSLVVCAPPMAALVQAGDVAEWDEDALALSLTEPAEFAPGKAHFVALIRDDGSVTTPIAVTPGQDSHEVILAVEPDFDIVFDDPNRDRTKYYFGTTEGHRVMTRVLGIRKRGRGSDGAQTIELTGVVEDDHVHLADNHLLPGPGEIQDPVDSAVTEGGAEPVPLVNMTDRTIAEHSASEVGPGIALHNNGSASELHLGGAVSTPIAGEWLSAPVEISTAAGYEVRASVVSSVLTLNTSDVDAGPPPAGSAVGVWLSLGTSRSWYLQALSYYGLETVLRIEIRQVDGLIQADHIITLRLRV